MKREAERSADFLERLRMDSDFIRAQRKKLAPSVQEGSREVLVTNGVSKLLADALRATSRLRRAVRRADAVGAAEAATERMAALANARILGRLHWLRDGISIQKARERGGTNKGKQAEREEVIKLAKKAWEENPRLSAEGIARKVKSPSASQRTIRRWIAPYKP